MLKFDLTTDTATPAFNRLIQSLKDQEPAMQAIGADLVARIRRGFDQGVSPYGQQWKKLVVRKGGAPLKQSGRMMRSIVSKADQNSVVVGINYGPTDAPSGATIPMVHQFGATIKPRNAKALRFPVGKKNGKTVYATKKQVTIPPRPFMPLDGLPPEWQSAALERIAAHLRGDA